MFYVLYNIVLLLVLQVEVAERGGVCKYFKCIMGVQLQMLPEEVYYEMICDPNLRRPRRAAADLEGLIFSKKLRIFRTRGCSSVGRVRAYLAKGLEVDPRWKDHNLGAAATQSKQHWYSYTKSLVHYEGRVCRFRLQLMLGMQKAPSLVLDICGR